MKNYGELMEDYLSYYRAQERKTDAAWNDKIYLGVYANYTKHFYDRARTLTHSTKWVCEKINKNLQKMEEWMQ